MLAQLTDSMASITSQLKTFARKNPESLSDINIKQTLEHVLKHLKNGLDEEDVEVAIDLSDQDLIIKADHVRLEQIFTNLFRNAADAVIDKDRKYVSLILSKNDEMVEAFVKDTGEGIHAENLNRVLIPFSPQKKLEAV